MGSQQAIVSRSHLAPLALAQPTALGHDEVRGAIFGPGKDDVIRKLELLRTVAMTGRATTAARGIGKGDKSRPATEKSSFGQSRTISEGQDTNYRFDIGGKVKFWSVKEPCCQEKSVVGIQCGESLTVVWRNAG